MKLHLVFLIIALAAITVVTAYNPYRKAFTNPWLKGTHFKNENPGVVKTSTGSKPGRCPLGDIYCSPGAYPPVSTCSDDNCCGIGKKCCYDICYGKNVCKTAYYG